MWLSEFIDRYNGFLIDKQVYYFYKLTYKGEMHLWDETNSVFYLSETQKGLFAQK